MGEYAELYTLQTFGVDISESESCKSEWKWQCKKCGRKLHSQQANKQHMQDKHGIEIEVEK